MKFTRSGSWHETSDCGRYTVAASKVDGAFLFQAWHGKELLKTNRDAEVCRQSCRSHAQGQP